MTIIFSGKSDRSNYDW